MVRANTANAISQAEPDWAARFQLYSQRAIVDQCVADAGNAADACECIGADQHAPARSSRHARIAPPNPFEWKKHLEEIDKGRNVTALGETLAPQLRHQRCEHISASQRLRHQPRNGVRCMHDIGISEQKIFGL